ncbi:hypothetical protein ACP3V3_02395 [Vibrio sp. PNB22_3_1]
MITDKNHFNLGLLVFSDETNNHLVWKKIEEYLDKLLLERKKTHHINVHFASNQRLMPSEIALYTSTRSHSLIYYPALNDKDNFFRSECLAICCDAAVIVEPIYNTSLNSEVEVLIECLNYWKKDTRIVKAKNGN